MRSSRWAWVLLLGACAPKNVPRCTCTNELLALGDPWSCTLSADRLDGPSSLEFSTDSRNLMANVQLSFTVKEGALTLGWVDAEGARTAVVTPAAPVALDLEVPMRKHTRSFSLSFAPGPTAVGMAGTVKYVTP